MRKFENSLETSSSKLRVVSRYLTDKSVEIKDVLLASASQQELKSKFKSLSSYNLGAGGTSYINTLVKSHTNASELANSDKSRDGARRLTPNESVGSSQSSLPSQVESPSYLTSVDLDTVLTDDSLAHLTLKWWSALERSNEARSDRNASETLLVDIQMTSCN
jgi:hypothetical protein